MVHNKRRVLNKELQYTIDFKESYGKGNLYHITIYDRRNTKRISENTRIRAKDIPELEKVIRKYAKKNFPRSFKSSISKKIDPDWVEETIKNLEDLSFQMDDSTILKDEKSHWLYGQRGSFDVDNVDYDFGDGYINVDITTPLLSDYEGLPSEDLAEEIGFDVLSRLPDEIKDNSSIIVNSIDEYPINYTQKVATINIDIDVKDFNRKYFGFSIESAHDRDKRLKGN